MTTLEEQERQKLSRIAQQIAKICMAHGLHFVGAVGAIMPDGESLAIVATHVTKNAFVASLLAQSIGPMMADSMAEAHQAVSHPPKLLGRPN